MHAGWSRFKSINAMDAHAVTIRRVEGGTASDPYGGQALSLQPNIQGGSEAMHEASSDPDYQNNHEDHVDMPCFMMLEGCTVWTMDHSMGHGMHALRTQFSPPLVAALLVKPDACRYRSASCCRV